MRISQWPTVLVGLSVYGFWLVLMLNWQAVPWPLLFVAGGLVTAWHGSYQHEVIHGHPTRWPWLNRLTALPPLLLWIPYDRYADTHRAHHVDEVITDPFDDPESYYLPQEKWARFPRWAQRAWGTLNTLFGRLVFGPFVAAFLFWKVEARLVWLGQHRWVWAEHLILSCLLGLFITQVCAMPLGLYILCFAFPGTSLIMLRSFLEHQWHENPKARTAIVEAGWFWRMLFMNNNLHSIHHEHPALPWYDLPKEYAANREAYLAANGSYLVNGYGEVAAKYAFTAKEPVRHPNR